MTLPKSRYSNGRNLSQLAKQRQFGARLNCGCSFSYSIRREGCHPPERSPRGGWPLTPAYSRHLISSVASAGRHDRPCRVNLGLQSALDASRSVCRRALHRQFVLQPSGSHCRSGLLTRRQPIPIPPTTRKRGTSNCAKSLDLPVASTKPLRVHFGSCCNANHCRRQPGVSLAT